MHVIVAGKEERRGRGGEVIASFWAESGPDSGSDSSLTPVPPPPHFLFLDPPSLCSMGSYIRKGMQIDMEIFTESVGIIGYASQVINMHGSPHHVLVCKSDREYS